MRHQNWHPADIIAALKKHGTSLAALSRKAGLSSSTLANALTRPWPKGELLIAQALDIPPDVIWPERYFDEKGEPIFRQMRQYQKEKPFFDFDQSISPPSPQPSPSRETGVEETSHTPPADPAQSPTLRGSPSVHAAHEFPSSGGAQLPYSGFCPRPPPPAAKSPS